MNTPKLGILGAGQLARMLALAATPLGVVTHCYSDIDACASDCADVTIGAWDDKEKLINFAESVDIITFESENIPESTIEILKNNINLYPNPKALSITQDRLFEKTFAEKLNIKTAEYVEINSFEDLKNGIETLGLPLILKTRRFGYDGKGQVRINKLEEIETAWEAINHSSAILEKKVNFSKEVSSIIARNPSGEIVFYPLAENIHKDGILRQSTPLSVNHPLQTIANQQAERIAREWDYVGVLAIEWFVVDNQLLLNEMAPRVHNSGHWTMDGAHCSQFENHVRAMFNWPLGDPNSRGSCTMINCIGELPERETILKTPGAHLHDYHKAPRAGRKVGHVNVVGENVADLEHKIAMF